MAPQRAEIIKFKFENRVRQTEKLHDQTPGEGRLVDFFVAAGKRQKYLTQSPNLGIENFVFDRAFDASVSMSKRHKLALVITTLFCQYEQNALLLQKAVSLNEDDRIIAAMALGFAGNRLALPALQKLLREDASIHVKKAAVFGISGLKDGQMDSVLVDVLIDALKKENEPKIIQAILSNLKFFKNDRLKIVFADFSTHSDISIRIAALGALFFSCDSEGVFSARACLRSNNASLRQRSLQVIERHGSFADVEYILPLLGDSDVQVRKAARLAIASLRRRRQKNS